MSGSAKTPLLVYSPFPPTASGIADYTFEQLPYLARDWDVTVVIDDDAPAPVAPPPGVRLLRRTAATEATDGQGGYRIYHVANNPHHEFVFQELRRNRGIVVLHDYVVHHAMVSTTLERGNLLGYHDLMETEYGSGGSRMARQRERYIFSEAQQFRMPLNGSLLENALGVIVHSAVAANRIREKRPGLEVTCIPHHFAPPPPTCTYAQARQALGIAPAKVIVSTLGLMRPQKQVPLVLQALRQVRPRMPDFEYWLVGEVPEYLNMPRRIREEGLSDRVLISGRLDLEQFTLRLAASDIVINLRYPSAGETSGTLIRAMGMEKCVIAFDYESYADYPSDAMLRVPLDTEDSEPLSQAILEAAQSPQLRQQIGQAAGRYVSRECSLQRCVSMYSGFVRLHGQAAPLDLRIGSSLGKQSKTLSRSGLDDIFKGLDVEDGSSWAQALQFIPLPQHGSRALLLGTSHSVMRVLRHHFGFQVVVAGSPGARGFEPHLHCGRDGVNVVAYNATDQYEVYTFDAETDRWPFSDEYFDLVVAGFVLENAAVDPMFVMSEINRVLKFYGFVLLLTPNVSALNALARALRGANPLTNPGYRRDRSTYRHNIEYSTHQVYALLHAAGMEVCHLGTTASQVNVDNQQAMAMIKRNGRATTLRGDAIVALGKKHSDVVDRYPATSYGQGTTVRRCSRSGPGAL